MDRAKLDRVLQSTIETIEELRERLEIHQDNSETSLEMSGIINDVCELHYSLDIYYNEEFLNDE